MNLARAARDRGRESVRHKAMRLQTDHSIKDLRYFALLMIRPTHHDHIRRCYSHARNAGLSLCLNRSISLFVELSMQAKVMNITRSDLHEAPYYKGVLYLALNWE